MKIRSIWWYKNSFTRRNQSFLWIHWKYYNNRTNWWVYRIHSECFKWDTWGFWNWFKWGKCIDKKRCYRCWKPFFKKGFSTSVTSFFINTLTPFKSISKSSCIPFKTFWMYSIYSSVCSIVVIFSMNSEKRLISSGKTIFISPNGSYFHLLHPTIHYLNLFNRLNLSKRMEPRRCIKSNWRSLSY